METEKAKSTGSTMPTSKLQRGASDRQGDWLLLVLLVLKIIQLILTRFWAADKKKLSFCSNTVFETEIAKDKLMSKGGHLNPRAIAL